MKLLITGLGISLVLFAGCASSSGKYVPACIAYEGSTLELADGRFIMDKFTDQVEVDDSGNTKDPFPGYPISGTYHFEGDVLHLRSYSGTELPNLYRVKNEKLHRLLTAEQLATWNADGTIDDCALTLGAGSGT